MEDKFDPMTGEPIKEETVSYDPMTGQPVSGGAETPEPMAYDPMTGQPVSGGTEAPEPMAYDPMTGQPVQNEITASQNVSYDPMTGQPVYHNMGFDPMTGQPVAGPVPHRKKGIGKKILVAAVPVLVVGVAVYAGIKSGLFLGKSGKVMAAVNNTFNDAGHLAEAMNFSDILDSGKYTVKLSGEASEGALDLTYSASSSEKAASGVLNIGGIPEIEFNASLDSDALKVSIPMISDRVFSYYYDSANDGYLMSQMSREEIEMLNSSLHSLYSNENGTEFLEDIKDSIKDEIKSLDFEKVPSQSYEVDGSSRTCKGYTTAITADNMLNILEDMEDVFGEAYEAQYGELFGGDFSEMRSGLRYMEDLNLTFYIYKNKLACIHIEYDRDDVEIMFLGGDTRMQNIEVRADGETVMELKGSYESGVERSRLYVDDIEVMEIEYEDQTGDFVLEMAEGGLYCRGNIQSGKKSFGITLDRLEYMYGYENIDFNGSLSITKGASDIDVDGEEFDIGNASLSDLETLGAEMGGLLGGMGSF